MAFDLDVGWFRKQQKKYPQLLSVIAQRIRVCLGVRLGTLKYIDLAVIFKAAGTYCCRCSTDTPQTAHTRSNQFYTAAPAISETTFCGFTAVSLVLTTHTTTTAVATNDGAESRCWGFQCIKIDCCRTLE